MGGGQRGRQGEMTEQQDENGPLCVCVCVCVCVRACTCFHVRSCAERERQTVEICCHRRCQQLVTGITANVTTSPIGQRASVSDLTGSASETNGLFLVMIGSCSRETWFLRQLRTCLSLPFTLCTWHICVCVCVCESV